MSDENACGGHPFPGPQHQLLQPFVGTFRATVRLWFGPGEPLIHEGTMKNSLVLGGLYLDQDYVGDESPGPWPAFLGKGFWGFNTTSNKYEGFWIDNASTMMQMETGDVDASGKVWEMHSNIIHPHAGPMQKRSVIRLIDHDHNDLTQYFTGQDDHEARSMEIQFVRATS